MISTYTIIAGNMRCPNDCPICISKMTPNHGLDKHNVAFNWAKFKKANQIAYVRGAQNVLITGKGEPTLYPEQISEILFALPTKQFERVELQTEGSNIANNISDGTLAKWRTLGLDLIAISIYHNKSRENGWGFGRGGQVHYDIGELVTRLNDLGFLVRISCVLRKGYIDDLDQVVDLISFCKDNNVFQLTLRKMDVPYNPVDAEVAQYVENHRLSDRDSEQIRVYIVGKGRICHTLPHGVSVYEVDGQNVSITTGLGEPGDNRQLIFFPQGWLTTSWETVQGSRII